MFKLNSLNFKKKKLNKKQLQEGMSLLEIIIVLGIMGVISAGVVVLAQRALDAQSVAKLTQNLNTIQVATVQTFRGAATGYPKAEVGKADPFTAELDGSVIETLVSLGRVSLEEVQNPLSGGFVKVINMKRGAEEGKAFGVVVEDVDSEQCKKIVMDNMGSFPYISVANTATSPWTTAPDFDAASDAESVPSATGTVIKSRTGGKDFTATNPTAVNALCNAGAGAAAADNAYSILFGNT